MSKNLIIVESPAKGKTIKKYLGKDYEVLASYGHVRDLVPKEGAVNTSGDFEMKYQIIERNEKHVAAIIKALKKADQLLLATDPDREGEAISWHLVELLREKGLLEGKTVKRVVFHEITKSAVQDAVANPRELSYDLVNAQQARRALDYLVGFNLSPLLWKKISRGLSAGRVQSPALRLIAEREKEIDDFIPEEYWTCTTDLIKNEQEFTARLFTLEGEKFRQFTITDGERAAKVKALLEQAANGKLSVDNIEKKQRKRNPVAPFTTSTLQQEAVRKLGFSAQRTMRAAQQLYEGIDTGDGAAGLITYMRTDSVTLSQDAIADIRQHIDKKYGKDYLPETPHFYKNKSKNAQEAHECVRITSADKTPEKIKSFLKDDQYKLYALIWKRTLACQMMHATMDQVSVDLGCGEGNVFRASGSTVKFPGFMKVYQEDVDDKKADDKKESRLPDMEKGDKLDVKEINLDQHFTEPPPRFTEASLVKTLEEYGIGRPSTYASIISTLQNREYVDMDARRFTPTCVGKVVNGFLSKHFTKYVDYDFTAKLEDELDAVSRGEKDWVPVIRDFWDPFDAQVQDKEQNVSIDEAKQARELGTDPESGKPVSVRVGRFGAFAQIGTKDDEDKPRFAGLRPGQKMDKITFEEAMILFQLPRKLGENKEGDRITAAIGRFGPYIKYDFYEDGAKKLTTKYASIKEEDGDDPYTITLERACEIVAEKKEADANKIVKIFDEDPEIQIHNGRWGAYLTNGSKNAKLPKDMKEKPLEIDFATARKLIDEAPEKRGRGKKKAAAKKKAVAKKAVAKKATSKKKTAKKKASSKKKATARKKVTASAASDDTSTETVKTE